jgi:hypothetical protein
MNRDVDDATKKLRDLNNYHQLQVYSRYGLGALVHDKTYF